MKDYPTFKVGDLVTWGANVGNLSDEALSHRRHKYGEGPFCINSTSPSPEAEKRPDKQLITIKKKSKVICREDGTPRKWSCTWFKKV